MPGEQEVVSLTFSFYFVLRNIRCVCRITADASNVSKNDRKKLFLYELVGFAVGAVVDHKYIDAFLKSVGKAFAGFTFGCLDR